jgi:O-antigen/teichoic acid export membrane protein
MSSARKHARNLVTNYSALVVNLVVMFFMSPFVVNTLGTMEYGIWSLLMVLTGYMGVLDLGIRASTGRHVMLYLGKEDHEAVDHTIRTSLGFFSLTAGAMLAVGLLAGLIFPSAFRSVPPEYHTLVLILLPVMAINVWFSAIGAMFSCVIIAHERFDIMRAIDIGVLALRTAGTIVALNLGYGLLGLTVVVVASNLAGLLANFVMAHRVYKPFKAWPLMLSRQKLRELMGYGVAAWVSNISDKIIGVTDQMVVGAAINVPAAAVYDVGAKLMYFSSNLMRPIGATFFPALQKAAARGESGSVKWLYLRQVRLAMILGILLNVGFIVFAEPFMRLWMLGPKFPIESVKQAATVMMILAASKLLLLTEIGVDGLLAATGRVNVAAAITMVEAVVNLGLSIFFVLVLDWGLAGVAAGTFFARLLVRTFVMPAYACRAASLQLSTFAIRIGGSAILSGGLFALACLGLRALIPIDSWAMFILAAGLALVAYAPIALLILVPAEDRRRILNKLHPGLAAKAKSVAYDPTRSD